MPTCVGDCGGDGSVDAADLVLMSDIALGNREILECSLGAVSEDGQISGSTIDQAVHNVFGECEAQPRYQALDGDTYHLAYPTQLVSLAQAAAIVTALDEEGAMSEMDIRSRLAEEIEGLGLSSDRFEEILVFAPREADDCDDCLATCSGRCVQSPRGDCFCYEPLPTDPAGRTIAVLLLESAVDEGIALDADRIPCKDTLVHAGVNDSFSTANGVESSSQSMALFNLIQASGHPPANFDESTIDRAFGQTFTLPQGKCLVAARVLLRVRPISGNPGPGSRNDILRFGFVDPTGQFVGTQWSAYFGSGNAGLPKLVNQQWTPSNYPTPGVSFVLDLGSLPGGTNLLPDLDAKRFLDIYIQDDSSIDYVDLVYRLCDCPTPTPTPSATPTRTRTPTLLMPTAIKRPTSTATRTRTASATASPTRTATRTRTPSPTRTPTTAVTPTPTVTPTPSLTPTPADTPTCIPPPAHLVAWWTLDEMPGSTTVFDYGLSPGNNGVPMLGPIESLPPNGPGPASVAGNIVRNPADLALFHYATTTYVEVQHSSELDLAGADFTVDAWVKPLPGPWSASREDLHIYPVVDKLNLATNTGYAFYVQVESRCPNCPPPPQQPPPNGETALTEMRLVLVLGDGSGLSSHISDPFYLGTGTLFPFPTPPSVLSPQPPGWIHGAVAVDRSQNLGEFWVDGSHLASSDFTPAGGTGNGDSMWVGGSRLYGTAYAPNFVEFTLNEIEVFDAALGQPEIQAIASARGGKCKGTPAPTATRTATPTRTATRTNTSTSTHTATRTSTPTPTRTPGCVTPPPNMIAWWTADNTTADSSGNGYNGAFFQGPGTYTAGMVGAAFSFPTIPDFIQASSTLNFAGNLSIDAWIRTANAGLAPIIDKRANAGSNSIGYYLFVLNGKLGFELGDGQPAIQHVSPGPIISDGLWHHVAVTVDRGSTTGGRLYVDGASVHTFDPTTRPGNTASGFLLRIGQQYVSAIAFQGAIDEVELFDRALLPQEIRDIFEAASFGKCKTPVPTATITRSPTVSQTPTRTRTGTPTNTRTPTRTPTAVGCAGAMCTPTPTRTPSVTPTPPCFAELCVFKFEDQDHDGVHDAGEPGLPGWTIHVSTNMNVVASVTTGAQGSFCTGIPAPAAYTVSEVAQSGWTQTFPPFPGSYDLMVQCGQLVNLEFGNAQNVVRPPTPTRTPSRTATRTPTRTSNIPPVD